MNVIVKNIPNTITCLNIASGFLAIMAAFGYISGGGLTHFEWCWILIGCAAVFDFFDGFAARMLKAYSDIGKELDSLCDLVSFGLAPAALMFNVLQELNPDTWMAWGLILIPIFGALRLAKFNTDTHQTTSFIGLPIPANAIFWIGYSALCLENVEMMHAAYVFIPALVVEAWMMVSPIKFFSLKFKTYGWKENQWRWLMIITTIAMVLIMGVPGLFWTIVVYLCYSLFDANDKK